MRKEVPAFLVSAALAAAIWALSAPVTGKSEPWDASGPYYFAALAVAGAVAGALVPRHLAAHYLGAILGQAAYELAFLPLGALFIPGLAFLAAYTTIFLGAAAIAAALRRRASRAAG